ncbi:hypothetical protein [Corynebacterium nuruki]|jgi:hypothetical protein|uniref:hypothetical protein n=1 Tax=Corynebacterium nuruki TaxID=1032851 RepID=UPI0013B39DA4|nr:hypothetical protein [Corynebacterium nuruki]MDN6438494.1 hypothetical protein [Corynebacterium nuruki]
MSTTSQVAPAARADGHAAAVTPAAPSAAPAVAAAPAPRSRADRFMLRMLRIDPATVDKIDTEDVRKAHRAFRWAVVVSAVRCTIMYVIIPVLIPMLSVLGSMAAPINIGLCLVAMGNGWLGVRRFWRTDHRGKWGYTWFMALIYAISIWTIIHEIVKLVA